MAQRVDGCSAAFFLLHLPELCGFVLAGGDERAAGRILDALRHFADIRFLRGERADVSLQATLLADEAYMQLLHHKSHRFENRRAFFLAAAAVIKNQLIDHARAQKAQKRGGAAVRVDLNDIDLPIATSESAADPEQISNALDKLEALSPRTAGVVRLRYFTGLSVKETAEVLEVSERTVADEWVFAKAWLGRELA